jgi:hypothetical protein
VANWLTGIGYALSIVSVALLAWAAWPAPGEDRLWAWVIVAGAVLSVIGMGLRWAAHIVQNRKIAEDN